MTSSSEERKRRRKSRQCQSRKRKAQAKLMRKIEKIDKDLAELKSNVCPSRKRTRSSSSSSSSECSSGESSSKSSTSSSSEDQSPQSSRRSSRRKYRSKSVPYHKSKYSRARDGSRRIPDGDFQKRQSGSKRKSRYTSYRSSTSHRESSERQSGTDKNKIAKKKPRAKDDTSETRLVVTNCESEEKSRRSDNSDGETRRRSTGDKITEMTMEVDDNNDADKSTEVPDIGEADHNDSAESGIVNVNKVVKINIKKTLTSLTDIVKDYKNNLSTESNRQKNESQVEDSRDKRKARKERNDSDYAVARKSYAKHKIHQRHETCSRNRPTNKDEEQPTIEEDKQNIIDNDSANEKLRKEPTDLLSDSLPNRSEEQQNFLEKEEQKHQSPELSEKHDHNSNIEKSSKVDGNCETNSTPRSNFVEESTPKTGDPNLASKSSIVDETTPQIRPARVLDAPRDSSIFEIRRRNDSELESFDVEQSSSRKLDSDEASGSEEARGAKRLKPNPPRDVSLLATPCPTRHNSPTVQSIVTLSHPVITVYMDTPTKATHGEEIRESHPRTIANESCDDIFSEDTDGESRVSAGKFELSNRILEDRIASTLAASSDNDEEGNDERAEKENSPIIDAEISVSNITEKVTEIEESAKEKNESSSDLIANENHESTTRIAKTDEQRKIDECRAKGTEGDAKENLDPETSKEEDVFTSEMVALSSGLVSMVDRQSELVPDVVKEEAEENVYPEVDKSLKDKVKTPTEELEDSESKIVAIDTRKQKDESPTTLRDESEKERPIEVFHRDEELTTEITEEKSVEDAESRRIEESRSTDESFEEKSNVARTITPCAVKFVAVKDDTQFKSKEFPPIAGKGEELPDMEVAIHEQEPSIDESDLSIDEILLTRDSEKLTQESKNDDKSPLSTVAETEEKMSIEVANSEELSAMTTTCSAGQAVEAVVTDTMEKDSDSVDEISKIATVEDNEHRFNIEASSNDGKSVSQNDDGTSMMLDIREDNNLLGAKNDESIEGAKETEQKMSIDVSNDKESAIDGIDSTILVNEDKCTVETMTEDGVDAASRKEESLPIECEEDAKKLMIIDYSDEFVDSSDESVDSSNDSSDSTISQSMSMDEFLTDEAESDKDENLLNASVEGAKIIRNIEESPCSEGSTRERFETASKGSTAKLPGASATEETPKFVSQSSIESSSLADETDATDLILKIDETDESKSLNNEHSQAELSETKNSFCSSEVFSEKNSCTMDDDDGNDRTLMIDETDENDTTIMIDEAGENDVTLKFDEIDENDATLKFDESPPPLMENKETSFYFEDPHQDEEEAELTLNKPGNSTDKIAKVCRDALALDTESKIFAESSHNVEKSTEETFQNSSEVLTSQSAMSGVGIDESAEVSKTIKSPIAATQTGEAVVAKITHHDSDSSDVNLAVSENTSANDSSSTSKASSTVEEISMNIDDMEVSSDDPNGSDDGTVSNSTIIASSTPNQASHMKNDESATIVATEKTTENIPIFRDDDVAFSDDARNTTSKFFVTSSESTEQQSAKVDIASTDDNSLSMSLSDEKIADIDEESRIAIELSDINFDDEFLYEKYVESPRQVVASTSVPATKTAAANAKIEPSGTKVAAKRDESSFARADDAEKTDSDNEISNDKDRDTTNEKSFASVSKLSKGQTLETAKNMDVDSSSADIESSTETSRNERENLDEDDTPKIVAIPDEESATKDDETKMLFEAEKELSKNIETRDLNLDVDTLEKMNVKSTVIPFEVASRTEKMSEDTTTKRDELHVLDSEQSLVEIIDEIIGETPTLSNEASNTADEISDGETSKNDDSLRKENAGSVVESIVNNEIAHGNKTRSSNEEAEKESQSKDEGPLPRDLALSTAVDCVESVNVEKSQSAVNSPEKDKTATIEPIFEAIATEPTESTDQSVPMEIDEEKSLSKEGIRESNVAEQGHDNVGAISRRADGEREIFRKHGYIKTVDLSIEDQIEENVIQTSADHRDKSPEKNSRVDAKSSSDVLPQRLRLVDNSIRERENNEKVEYSPRKTDSLETIDSRAIDPILIADWSRIMKQGLANGVQEDLTKKHHNDDHVFPRTPTLNAELRRFMSDVLLKRDQHYVSTERQLCGAIIAIGKSITEIGRKNLSNDLAKGLSDAGEILSNLHYENGLERRSCIFSGLGAFVDAVAGRSRVDSFLFEDEKKIETADENKFPDKPAENSLQENIMETLIESSTALRESFGTSKIVDASTKSDKISLSKKIDDEQATSEKRDAGEEDEGVPLTKLSDIISSMENYIDDVEEKADFVEEIPVIRPNEAIACISLSVARSKDRDNSSEINFETKSVDVSIIDDEPKETKNGASTSKNLETEQQEMDCEESSMSDRDSAASVINISDASSEEPNESTAEPATSASSAKVEEKSKTRDVPATLSLDTRSETSMINEKIDDANNECVVTFARTRLLSLNMENYDDAVDRVASLDGRNKSQRDPSIRETLGDVPPEETIFSKDDDNEEPDECVVTYARTVPPLGTCKNENDDNDTTISANFFEQERCARSTESRAKTSEKSLLPAHNIASSSGFPDVKDNEHPVRTRLEEHSYYQSIQTSSATKYFENDGSFLTPLSSTRVLYSSDFHRFSQKKTYQRSADTKKLGDVTLNLRHVSEQPTRAYTPKFPSNVSTSMNRDLGVQERNPIGSLSLDRVSAISLLEPSQRKNSAPVAKPRVVSSHLDESSTSSQSVFVPSKSKSSLSGYKADYSSVPSAANLPKQYADRNANKLSRDSRATTSRKECSSASALPSSEKSERPLNYRQASFGGFSSENIDNRRSSSVESTRESQSGSSRSERPQLPRHIRVRDSSRLQRSAIARSSRVTVGGRNFDAWYKKNHGPEASTSDLCLLPAASPPQGSDLNKTVARKRVTASCRKALRTSSPPELPHDQSGSSRASETQSPTRNVFATKYPLIRPPYGAAPETSKEIKESSNNNGGAIDKNKKIPEAWGTVKVQAKGAGYAILQMTVQYNVDIKRFQTPPPIKAFDLVVRPNSYGRNQSHINYYSCQRWTHINESSRSGMAVLDVTIPTGYIIQQQTLDRYILSRQVRNLQRARFQDRKVLFYFDYLDGEETCVNFTIERWYPVANMSRYLPVRVYDYYAPERFNETIFDSLSTYILNICEVCGSSQCPYCHIYNAAALIGPPTTFVLLLSVLTATARYFRTQEFSVG